MTDDPPNTEKRKDSPFAPQETDWKEEWERPNGFLHDIDRRYLWGLKTYDDASGRSHRRKKIRERTVNGLLDLSYLGHIEDEQQEKLLSELAEETDDGDLRDAVESLIVFLYRNLDDSEAWLEETVTNGITTALMVGVDDDRYGFPSVNTEIDADAGVNLSSLERRLSSRSDTLSPREIGLLVRSGRVDADDIEKLRPGDRGDNPTMGTRGGASDRDFE